MGINETPPIDYTKHITGVTTSHNWRQGSVVSHTVMNRDFSQDHPEELDLNKLNEQFKRGIPSSWINTRPRIYINTSDNPTLLAKIRRKHHEKDVINHPDQTMGWLDFRHEFQVAFEAAEILSSQNIQSSIKAEGFDMLIPVMPILGVDVEDTNEQIVIYPYVSGIHMDNEKDPKKDFYFQRIQRIVRIVKNALELRNINPLDLSFLQFIVNPKTNTLYLVDMEGYFKKTR